MMNYKKTIPKLLYATGISLLFTSIGYGQKEYDTVIVRDLETWTSAEVNFKLNKKIDFDLSHNLRLQHNTSKLERTFTEIGGSYKVNKHLKFGIGYRFIWEQKKESIQNSHRWNIDGAYKFEIGELTGQTRIRFQSGKDFPLAENAIDNHVRLKLKLDYNIKDWKFDPQVSAEVFRAVGDLSSKSFDKLRLTVGTSYNFNKKHAISMFYGFEKELNQSYPKATYLVGLSYKYTLKAKKNEE